MLPNGTYNGEKNKEWPHILAENDTVDLVRTKWFVQDCPFEDECCVKDKTKWKDANVWSYISEDKARCYMAHHLCKSGKHWKEEEEAMTEASYVSVETKEDIPFY